MSAAQKASSTGAPSYLIAGIVGSQIVHVLLMTGLTYLGACYGLRWLGYLAALVYGITSVSNVHATWLKLLQSVTVGSAAWILWDKQDGDSIIGILLWLADHYLYAVATISLVALVRVLIRTKSGLHAQNHALYCIAKI